MYRRNRGPTYYVQADRGRPRVTLWPGVDLLERDAEYGFDMGSPSDNSGFVPGMEVVFLKSRYTPVHPSEHICEDLIEAVVVRLVGKKTVELRQVSMNGIPSSGIISSRVDSMGRYFLKRRLNPGETPSVLDPGRLPWLVDSYTPPPPLVSAL